MGYTTDFEGSFKITPPLTEAHREYLVAFNESRRMRRDPAIAATLPDPKRTAINLDVGDEGGLYVGASGFGLMEYQDGSVLDVNGPPAGQPGLWCQWRPSNDGTRLEWDQNEKFDNYVEWLEYLMGTLLLPWGYTLNGSVDWRGEEFHDTGTIHLKVNKIAIKKSERSTRGGRGGP
jgi:hypothetical protein